jgi:hypothetical protein
MHGAVWGAHSFSAPALCMSSNCTDNVALNFTLDLLERIFQRIGTTHSINSLQSAASTTNEKSPQGVLLFTLVVIDIIKQREVIGQEVRVER